MTLLTRTILLAQGGCRGYSECSCGGMHPYDPRQDAQMNRWLECDNKQQGSCICKPRKWTWSDCPSLHQLPSVSSGSFLCCACRSTQAQGQLVRRGLCCMPLLHVWHPSTAVRMC